MLRLVHIVQTRVLVPVVVVREHGEKRVLCRCAERVVEDGLDKSRDKPAALFGAEHSERPVHALNRRAEERRHLLQETIRLRVARESEVNGHILRREQHALSALGRGAVVLALSVGLAVLEFRVAGSLLDCFVQPFEGSDFKRLLPAVARHAARALIGASLEQIGAVFRIALRGSGGEEAVPAAAHRHILLVRIFVRNHIRHSGYPFRDAVKERRGPRTVVDGGLDVAHGVPRRPQYVLARYQHGHDAREPPNSFEAGFRRRWGTKHLHQFVLSVCDLVLEHLAVAVYASKNARARVEAGTL